MKNVNKQKYNKHYKSVGEQKSILIGIGMFIFIIWLFFNDEPKPQSERANFNSDTVAHDLEQDIQMTQKINNPNDNYHQKSHTVQWLRPAGKEYGLNKDPNMVRLWKEVQQMKK